ncbi:MAG: hypothetical protein AAGI53_05855 [Planctomycetota bacterium]
MAKTSWQKPALAGLAAVAAGAGVFIGQAFFVTPEPPSALVEVGDEALVREWWSGVDDEVRDLAARRASEDPHEARLYLRYVVSMELTDASFDTLEPFVSEVEFYEPLTQEQAELRGAWRAAWDTLAHVARVSWLWARFGPFPDQADRISAVAIIASKDGEQTLVAYAVSLLLVRDRDGVLSEEAKAELERLRENEFITMESDRVTRQIVTSAAGSAS